MISIITPTYQRANNLFKLFSSLLRQDNFDFEWIIIDDGSCDETQKIVASFINPNFKVRYFYKENGGKCSAINLGVKVARYDYIFIVDSDDWLTDNSIKTIHEYLYLFNEYPIFGISFFRMFSNGKVNGSFFKKNIVSNYITVRINRGDGWHDKAEVFSRKILVKYPFPVFGSEKFLAENILWIPLSYKYSMAFINKAIYIGDYCPEGLTKNVYRNKLLNPIGSLAVARTYTGSKMSLLNKIKGTMLYYCYSRFAKRKLARIIQDAPRKILLLILLVPSSLYYLWQKRKKYD
jgi:glycosyltransferase involved in cell wall biosynthesis